MNCLSMWRVCCFTLLFVGEGVGLRVGDGGRVIERVGVGMRYEI